MAVDILKSCVDALDIFAYQIAKGLDEDNVDRTAYNIKAMAFNASTILGIVSLASAILGSISLPLSVGLLGVSLLGRVIAEQSMSPMDRGVLQIFNWNVPVPFLNHALVSFGNFVVFYDVIR